MPNVTEERLDATFMALADPTRRAIVVRLARGDATVNELAAPFDMTLPGISKHLKVLENCGLDLAQPPGAVPSLPPRTSSPGWRRRLDGGAAAPLGRAVRQARRPPPGPPESTDRNPRQAANAMSADQGRSAGGEQRFSRIVDASRELTFRCMIEPEHLTHFWGPAGTSAPLEDIRVDARPGGVFETVMVNDVDGSRYPTSATYLEVDEPERLVWRETHSGMTVTITFTELDGGRTAVEIHQVHVPEPAMRPEAQAGFETSLDRFCTFVEHLEREQR